LSKSKLTKSCRAKEEEEEDDESTRKTKCHRNLTAVFAPRSQTIPFTVTYDMMRKATTIYTVLSAPYWEGNCGVWVM
jgi:hypothetical protein